MTGILVSFGLTCAAFLGCNRGSDNRPDVCGPNFMLTWPNDGESGAGGTVFRVGTLFAIWTSSPNGGGGSESGNVATDDDGCRVQQLNRDLSALKFELTELKDVAESDTEIAEFFAGDQTEAQHRSKGKGNQ